MTIKSAEELTRAGVAEILQCSIRTTYTYEKDGIIPIGRIINNRGDKRWKRSEIEAVAENFPYGHEHK